MSKRKGLSLEEKRQKMLELFHEKKDFFNLKELEKIAPKEKGIVAQSVKDVVQSLVDDSLVDTDKIGTSVYFWAFPSKAVNSKRRLIAELEAKLHELEKKHAAVSESVARAECDREETEERKSVLCQLEAAKKKRDALDAELKRCRDCDPIVIEAMKKDVAVSRDAANRWTDNIFAVKSWCKNKFFIEESLLNKQFGIDDDMDYVE